MRCPMSPVRRLRPRDRAAQYRPGGLPTSGPPTGRAPLLRDGAVMSVISSNRRRSRLGPAPADQYARLDQRRAERLLRPTADRLSPLPVAAVTIRDGFWAPRLEVNRTRTLDHVLKEIESTGGLRNFDIAAGQGHRQVRRPVLGRFGRLQMDRRRVVDAREAS